MTSLEIIHKVRLVKQAWRRGDINTDQFRQQMDTLQTIVASRNETC